jgi:thiamine biosynthesis lipoprotein
VLVCGIFALHKFRPKLQKITRFAMDTIVTIQAPGGQKTADAINKALDRVDYISWYYNPIDKRSPVYAFNHSGTPISDPDMVKLIASAIERSEATDGAFDITIFPIFDLWGFNTTKPHMPDKKDIETALKKVGYKSLYIKDGKVYKKHHYTMIELGGIAKGYAVSEMARILKENGIKSALIDAGGDIMAIGKLYGKPWKVGIKDPRSEGVIGIVGIDDGVAFSSGDYERFFIKDGVRYCHIFNTKTGYPVQGLSGVSVFSDDPLRVTGWSSAIFALGKDKGLELVKKEPFLKAVVIDADQHVFYSDNLKDDLTIKKIK